ncbi:spore protease YyaC [Aneurinibacillus aneurinilyticus]|uniref:Spore protease YyaC n=2 Tax=Aneurinibacillus aneurinilyticus TaxID=1391 RepID=A0A848CHM9_ANEAE|nr:spore protease YyaC [Aneurinibacillus aneurinilyticus]MCI1692638.1 spore protease YyaC [Aneurinibacillus aneurinilyticus]MED0672773.1 spore protease YyaC [Aneurinibacillus aneurinilyticus]MED0708600.1 spore protease YyaC [Aneurinibacillus aneurinilyticus]MED0721760.1 spore protease YyaC [Aneurinibacillus aneurinilyticus]MED0731884.1 spore protease YyaC [Aneurinibacillus aneurinilyticus]
MIIQMHYKERNAAVHLCNSLTLLFRTAGERPLVFVCIGTIKASGDALGPMIGTLLQDSELKNTHIYGTIKEPVHALNLQDTMQEIYEKYTDPFIVAIDASLGHLHHIGYIQLVEGPLFPGNSMKKSLPQIGDIHIKGIVNTTGPYNYMMLQNANEKSVRNMAKTIATALFNASALIEKNVKKAADHVV